jgi:hypothetical protein
VLTRLGENDSGAAAPPHKHMLALGVTPDPRRREMSDSLFCLQCMYPQQLAVFAAVIPLDRLHMTLPPVETIQRAAELILAELSSPVRAPQLPTDAINMLIDTAAAATFQRWIALICFHRSIALSLVGASVHDRPALYSIALNTAESGLVGPVGDNRAVVDQYGRVHGIKGLHIGGRLDHAKHRDASCVAADSLAQAGGSPGLEDRWTWTLHWFGHRHATRAAFIKRGTVPLFALDVQMRKIELRKTELATFYADRTIRVINAAGAFTSTPTIYARIFGDPSPST